MKGRLKCEGLKREHLNRKRKDLNREREEMEEIAKTSIKSI